MKPALQSVAVLVLLIGCRAAPEEAANGPDPLQALVQHVESSRYGPEYWKRVAEQDSALWRKATEFCGRGDASEYPTCASVKMVDFLRTNTRPAARPDPFTFRTDRAPDTARARDDGRAPGAARAPDTADARPAH